MKIFFTFFIGLLLPSFISAQDIVASYKLNGDGSDSGINNFNAFVNGAVPAEDRFGNTGGALFFDGFNDYLRVSNQDELNFGLCDFAISLWLKTSSDDFQMVLHNGSDGSSPQYWLRLKDYSDPLIDLRFLTGNISGGFFEDLSGSSLYDNNWHHIVTQRIGNWQEIYFDGTLVSAGENSEIIDIINEDDLLIGAQHPHPTSGFPDIYNYFNGSLDDLVFFKEALTEEQVESIFNEVPTSIEEPKNKEVIGLYPNPATHNIKVQGYHLIDKRVQVVDNTGKTIKSIELLDNNINISMLPSGSYFLIFTIKNKTKTIKFVKE